MAIDEIEELGASLLQRQRTTRKRKQKRIDKDKRNALWLQVAGQGISLTNTVLRNRADNFVNTTEEFVGQRLLYGVGLKDRDYIISEYEKASQTPGGVEAYLTEQYKTPIQNSLNRQFEMDKWDKDDQDTYVFSEALKAAKEFAPKFEAGYKTALSMPDIGDYDAYIKSRDGRSENVGGFIFNKLSRMFNNRTQEDVDVELIKEVSNSRYADSAAQMKIFRTALDKGYNTLEAKTFANNTPRDLEMKLAGLTDIVPEIIDVDFEIYGKKQTISLIQYTAKRDGRSITWRSPIYQRDDTDQANFILNEEGEKQLANPQGWRNYSISRAGIGAGVAEGLTTNQINLLDPILIRDTTGHRGTCGIFSIPCTVYNDVLRGAHNFEIPGLPRIVNDYVPDYAEKVANLDPEVADAHYRLVLNAARSYQTDEKDILMDNLIGMSFAGGEKAFKDLVDDEREGVIEEQTKLIGVESAINSDLITNNYGIESQDASTLAVWQYLVSLHSGFDEDLETYIENENFIEVKRFFATTAIAADSRLEEVGFGARVDIPEASYKMLAVEAIGEVVPPKDNDGSYLPSTHPEALNIAAARNLLNSSEYFTNQTIDFSTENLEPKEKAATEAIVKLLADEGFIINNDPKEIMLYNPIISVQAILNHFDKVGGFGDPSAVSGAVAGADVVDASVSGTPTTDRYERMGKAAKEDFEFIFNTIFNAPATLLGSAYNLATQPNVVTRAMEKAAERVGIPSFLRGLGFPSIPTPSAIYGFFQGKGQELTSEEIRAVKEWTREGLGGEDSPK